MLSPKVVGTGRAINIVLNNLHTTLNAMYGDTIFLSKMTLRRQHRLDEDF